MSVETFRKMNLEVNVTEFFVGSIITIFIAVVMFQDNLRNIITIIPEIITTGNLDNLKSIINVDQVLKKTLIFIGFLAFSILVLLGLKNTLLKQPQDFIYDSNHIDNKELRNEPYYIQYINPYITNLKTLNFNYRVLYNGGFDMKVFLKAKMNEFLIGSYVQFLDVLTYRKQPFIPITFNNNSYKQGLYLYNNNNETTGLFLIKSGLINFETQTQNYMYIFEETNLPYYDLVDNICVIKNNGSMLNTRELQEDKNYVYCELEGELPLDFKIINKQHYPTQYLNTAEHTTTGSTTNNNELKITSLCEGIKSINKTKIFNLEESDFEYKTGATSLQLTSGETGKYIEGSRKLILKKTSKDNVTFYKGTMNRNSTTADGTTSYEDTIKNITITSMTNYEKEKYKDLFLHIVKPTGSNFYIQYIFMDDINNNSIQRLLIKPIICLNKNNVKRPIYYKNNKNKTQTIKYKNWLLSTFKTFLKTQFKNKVFKINYIYKQYSKPKSDIFAKNLKNVKCAYTNSFDDPKPIKDIKSDATLTYQWKIDSVKDIKFDDNVNETYVIKNPKKNDYGFVVYLCNSSMPVDINDEPLDLLDKKKDIMFDCIMPHIAIQHYKFNTSDEENNGVLSQNSILYETNESVLQFDPFLTQSSDISKTGKDKYLGDIFWIKLHKNKLNDYNLEGVDNEWDKYIYNHIEPLGELNSVKIPKEDYDRYKSITTTEPDQKSISTKNYITSITNNQKKISEDIYITAPFAFTKNQLDYGIKMKLIAQIILQKYYSNNLNSIITASYNLSNLSIIPIKLIGDNYIYFKNNIPKKVILTNKPLTFSNINDIYYNSSLRGIQDLRTDYCKWIMDIMTKTVWTKGGVINEQRPDIWTEKSLLNYINKSPYDKVSKKLNISMQEYQENEKEINFRESNIYNIPHFIKIENKQYVIYRVKKDITNGNIKSVELLNKNKKDIKRIVNPKNKIYDFSDNMISKKTNFNIKKIYIYPGHKNIFTVQFDKKIHHDDIPDYFSFSTDIVDISILEPATQTEDNNNQLINGYQIYKNKVYENITKKNLKGQYQYPDNINKKIYVDYNKYKDISTPITLPDKEIISSDTTYLTFYSNDIMMTTDTTTNNITNIFTDSINKEKINVFTYENKERYEELIITEKKFIQTTKNGPKTLKTLIKFKNPLIRFYRNVVSLKNNDYEIDYNIKKLVYDKKGLSIKTPSGIDTDFMTIEDHFQSDLDGTNLMILKTMIIINESVKIHYNIPQNIGIEEQIEPIPQLKCSNEIWIPYKFRNRIIDGIHSINSRTICTPNRGNDNMEIKTLNTLSKYRIFDYENYLSFYLNIFETITGIYTDIDNICQKNKLYKTNNWHLPQSFNNYLSFDNYLLFYRNDESIMNDSNIKKEMMGKPVLINNKLFDGNMISLKQSNNYNNELVKKYFKSFCIQNKIGEQGYSYKTALEICSRTYTAQNINPTTKKGKNCRKGIYKQQKKDNFNPDIEDHNNERDKCFNIIYNTKTQKEIKELKEKGQFIFGTKESEKNKIEEKYKEPNLRIIPHRIANIKDIKSGLYYNMDWTGAVWTDQNHYDIKNNNSLLSLRTDEDKEKVIDIYSNPNQVPNKGVMCFGRKEPGESTVSKAKLQYLQKEKEIKEIMERLRENDERISFNNTHYSKWSD